MSVFGSEEDIPTGINWSEVFRDASVNGVSALCYEAVRRLPAERQPNVDLLLRWQLSARSIREQFRYRHDVTRSLFDILNEKGIRTLLLRGETLACNYPDPELRESSLVGFTALTDTRTCDSLLWSHGIAVSSQRNLSSFTYKGVRFENYNLDESLPLAVRRSDGCLEPDPVTQAVLVVMHIARQVRCSDERIPLKALLDLALLLCHYPDIVESWEPKLREVRLHRFSRVMLCATDMLLATDRPSEPMHRADSDHSKWNRRTMRRARKFIRIFMTDNNVNARHLARHAFLPPRIWEWLRIMFERDSED
ncbi:MAG: nucleotidyltransferase family protein [Bacteroidaceae bacterium]|nr:nucleotidyltransferase family protein [Bacteroidaceae bacterium]